jgi:ribosomal protein L37AE/L43A
MKKKEEKVVEICQDCGKRKKVAKACPTGWVCDECLAIAADKSEINMESNL